MARADYLLCPICDGKVVYVGDRWDGVPDDAVGIHQACLDKVQLAPERAIEEWLVELGTYKLTPDLIVRRVAAAHCIDIARAARNALRDNVLKLSQAVLPGGDTNRGRNT